MTLAQEAASFLGYAVIKKRSGWNARGDAIGRAAVSLIASGDISRWHIRGDRMTGRLRLRSVITDGMLRGWDLISS